MQEKGRFEVFLDYHLRVGQLTKDTQPPHALREQRLDEAEAGQGTTVTLIDTRRDPAAVKAARPEELAKSLGLAPDAVGLIGWDLFDAVLAPGEVILLLSWRDHAAAEAFERQTLLEGGCGSRTDRFDLYLP
ncbi:MAG TPA: hypothetical protein VH083_19135 [Myxococcales bacterium]|nr:hypothetical protein [Myxococcales bacterium]